jgi:hypothetical protein
MKFEATRVPPPNEAPVYDATQQGALRYLRIIKNAGPCRCACCGSYIGANQSMAWVPDFTRRSDTLEDLIEASRCSAFNGHHSGWCMDCASSVGRKPAFRRWLAMIIAEARRVLTGYIERILSSAGRFCMMRQPRAGR